MPIFSHVSISDKEIGKILKDIRINKGISQELLAQQLNKGQSDIAKIESGRKKLIFIDFLLWCKNLGMSITETTSIIDQNFKELWSTKSLWSDE